MPLGGRKKSRSRGAQGANERQRSRDARCLATWSGEPNRASQGGRVAKPTTRVYPAPVMFHTMYFVVPEIVCYCGPSSNAAVVSTGVGFRSAIPPAWSFQISSCPPLG